jgi:hypothetical protein
MGMVRQEQDDQGNYVGDEFVIKNTEFKRA